MGGFEGAYVTGAATAIDLMIAVVVAFHAGWAMWAIVRGGGADGAKLIVARGVLAGLGFSMAGSLLKVIALANFASIRTFAFVFAFRTLLKQVFLREERMVAARRVGGPL